MGYVTKEEVECKSCGRIVRKNELQYDSPEGRICLACYGRKQPRQTTPLKEIIPLKKTPRMPETIDGEKLLGCIRAEGSRGREVLAFTPNRVFVARLPTGAIFGGGYSEDAIGIAFAVIDLLSVLSNGGKTEGSVATNLEEFLKADKTKIVISNSEIREVELRSWRKASTLSIMTSKRKYERVDETNVGYEWNPSKKKYERKDKIYIGYQWNVAGLIPEKKDVKLEDYENILRPVFGDKLSVK